MSVRTGMYHFEVSRTAMYRVRYVLVRTSTYRHVLPCTRCTGFQMEGRRGTRPGRPPARRYRKSLQSFLLIIYLVLSVSVTNEFTLVA
jgi:hypothetical protein